MAGPATSGHGRLLTGLPAFQEVATKSVVLYSGGLDSSYFLAWAAAHGIDVVALCIDLGGGAEVAAAAFAGELGIPLISIDGTEQFATEFVAPAIQANCLHQGIFPVSSSLSRPLMAKIAVRTALDIGADCIVHTAELHQNSRARFNRSIRALAPALHIANPFLESRLSRRTKLDYLHRTNAGGARRIYSVDSNIWARVIENGELDSMTNPVGDHVFEWTVNPGVEAGRTEVAIGFQHGLPVSLNGREMPLVEVIRSLNQSAGAYGIGRFNGVEGTQSGLKNHEVREAPAAAAILAAHMQLEQVVLTDQELRLKALVDRAWTETVVLGGWYSDIREALGEFERRVSIPVSGVVRLMFQPGSAYVLSVEAAGDLSYGAPEIATLSQQLTYEHLFDLETIDLSVRRHDATSWLDKEN